MNKKEEETMNLIRSTVKRRIAMPVSVVLCICCGVFARAQMQQQYLQAQRANAQAMRKYIGKSRVEVRKNSESKNVQLYLLRYDPGGTLQRTPIGGSARPDLPTRGIRGRVAQKRLKSFQETVDELTDLVKRYSNLPPAKMQDFLAGRTLGASDDR